MTERPPDSLPRRILVIDDTESIHSDFEKVLSPSSASESERALEELDRLMFDEQESGQQVGNLQIQFDIAHAYQGKEGLEKVKEAIDAEAPYSVAFVDMRMPPGWDGLKTVEEISKRDPHIQLVICSAYSDYSWRQIIERVGHTDRLLILKKPFDQAEVYQLAVALSEKWQTEQRTRELLNELENKVARRTSQLTKANKSLNSLNAELQVAVDEARAAERAKGRFLATMSHEIRTTLNGIIGASHMLNHSSSLPESDKEFAGIIQKSGDALMIIINDILDYSKYESGQLELEQTPFSLKDLAKECTNLMDTSLANHNITLEVEFDPKLPQLVVGDPARIRQVVLNLLNNAFKFGRDGTVTLAIKAESVKNDSVVLRIEIRDQGIGMTPDTLERLFSAFMQADSSTTREYGGTGLGLAICKLLADAMAARIDVSSELGEGSVFAFILELALPEEDAKPADIVKTENMMEEAASVRKAVDQDFGNRRILLADDNAINRKLGKRFLQQMKLDVTLACNGKQAVELASEQCFDLILMDLQMPELDGITATQRIREINTAGKTIPIVALTANAFAEVREQCKEAGMNDFLTKPLRVNELASTLERWFATSESPPKSTS
ncbi:ATPase, histidine kinase-, DNA gyrase B-, and HSP90-like domain protein [Verrucomicrobiia bacterium DG1235]|nr:ATPase, histidine kinase-, DNA gyrase B-, and HSP90-like domain protein [Verrucomicrobiae bacterium DG1235]